MDTPKAQDGTWTLTAPDGRTWQADSPSRACSLEQRERVPAFVALKRILDAADEPLPDEARWRFLVEHWQSLIGGIPLHRWLDEQKLRLGGVEAALDYAVRHHENSDRHIA